MSDLIAFAGPARYVIRHEGGLLYLSVSDTCYRPDREEVLCHSRDFWSLVASVHEHRALRDCGGQSRDEIAKDVLEVHGVRLILPSPDEYAHGSRSLTAMGPIAVND